MSLTITPPRRLPPPTTPTPSPASEHGDSILSSSQDTFAQQVEEEEKPISQSGKTWGDLGWRMLEMLGELFMGGVPVLPEPTPGPEDEEPAASGDAAPSKTSSWLDRDGPLMFFNLLGRRGGQGF